MDSHDSALKYGFDLDGTLDQPKILAYARKLQAEGHEVHVITGGMSDTGEWTLAARKAKLASLNFEPNGLHRCFGTTLDGIGIEKARVCREQNIVEMWEDSPIYAQAIKLMAPMTAVRMVWEL